MPLTFVPEYDFSRPMGFVQSSIRPHDEFFIAGSFGSAPKQARQLDWFPYAFQKATEDQRQTSSCTGNAAIALMEFLDSVKQAGFLLGELIEEFLAKIDRVNFSRLFPYYFAREKRGWQNSDGGAVISDIFEVLGKMGCPLEPYWMFKESLLFTRPDSRAIAQAARHLLVNPRRVPRESVFEVISGGGDHTKARPVVCGVQVYQHRFFAPDVQKTGWIDMPSKTSDYAGGHALLFTGYDIGTEDWVEGPNSWGQNWASQSVVGRAGWFRMNAQYLRDPRMSDDFWTGDYVRVKETS